MEKLALNNASPERYWLGVWPILITLVCWTIVICLSVVANRPIAPLPETIPADQFSATRADKILELLVGDGIPHPAGSEQNRIVRARIVNLLKSYGYQVEVQHGMRTVDERAKDRSPDKDEIDLYNIIATRTNGQQSKATANRKLIMLAAHYDSVPFGPGACDDAVGTAALLEIARMLANDSATKHDLIFLISDAEEFGLLGAKHFVKHHPLADQVDLVINVEARGTTGPSIMFETSRMSRSLIPIFASTSRRPFASSLFYEIYKRQPNDTDFSVFREHGMLGYNFAFIGDVRNYHTPADNFQNADRGSMQHHGENVLGLVRAIVDSDELDWLGGRKAGTSDEAVYFDLFGKWILWWPSSWSLGMSLAAILLCLIATRRFHQTENQLPGIGERQFSTEGFLWNLNILVFVIICVVAAGCLLHRFIQQDPRFSNPWPLQPVPILFAYWLTGFAITGGLAIACSKWLTPLGAWSAFLFIWCLLAVVTSIRFSGGSHLFVVPILSTSIFAAVVCRLGIRGFIWTVIFAAIAVGLMWLQLERLFYDAVGFKMPLAMMIRISMASTALLVLLSATNSRTRFAFSISMSVGAVIALVAATILNAE